uniref:3-hydroxyisobutyrate dehydrogenase n=1 Tax=Plectus sambesii TaxID=2011161 RepID=A0A914USS7_9BILA
LPSSPHVQSVYTGDNGIFKTIQKDTLCMDSSTIDQTVSIEMANLAKQKGAAYMDTPVSGGVVAAQNGLLTFMCGGDGKSFARAEPFLSQMGKNVVHCGDVGTGQAAKICNNMLLGISMIGVSETMNLGEKLGLKPEMLAKIINTSSGRCWSSDTYNPVPGVIEGIPCNRQYAGGFGSSLMAKDLGLAQNAATSVKAATPLGSLAHQIYRLLAQSPEFQGKDFSVVYQFLKDQTAGSK